MNWKRILFETNDLIKMLPNVKADDSDILVKIDVSDFFLSGKHHDVVDACVLDWKNDKKKPLIIDTLWFLLMQQYVASPGVLKGRLWRAILGSGMGLPLSSTISDLALLKLADKKLIPHLATFWIELSPDIEMMFLSLHHEFFFVDLS